MNTEPININNYLEWFLSYADNELSIAEIASLLDFVHQHPQLQTELDEILQTKILPDTTIGFDKKQLFKKEDEFTDEQIITYLDNEYSVTEKNNFENKISSALSEKINAFKQTYAQPDLSIVFEDKKRLYKHSSKSLSLVPFMKIAAGILIIIGLGMGGYSIFIKKEVAPHIITAVDVVTAKPDTSSSIQNKSVIDQKSEVQKLQKTEPALSSISIKKETTQQSTITQATIIEKEVAIVNIAPIPVVVDDQINNQSIIQTATNINAMPIDLPANNISMANNDNITSEKNKKNTLLNTKLNNIKDKILYTLSGGEDEINIAIFAINTKNK